MRERERVAHFDLGIDINKVHSSDMERSVLVEENHQRSNSTPISKSSGSIIRIDAISIELASAMENNCEASKCEHFSIRGYAAEMRKKDISVCLPFPFDGNQNKLEEQANMLPPLHVAKFRWWRCQNCLREIGGTSVAEETGIVCDQFQSGVISTSTCPHIFPNGTAMVLSDLQISPDPGHLAGRKTDGNNSGKKDEIRLSSCCYNKEKKHEIGCAAVVGNGNGARTDVDPMHDLPASNPWSIQERHATGPNEFVSKAHGFMELCAPNYRIHASADLKNPERMARKSSEIRVMGTLASYDGEQRIASMAPHGMNFSKGQTGKRPSLDLEENDEILAESGHRDQHMDSPSLSTRQRTRKVRLLAELLGSKRNSENDRIRTEGGPSCGIPTMSSGLDTVSSLRDHLAVQGSIRKHFEDPKGKRKMSLDKEGKSPRDLICSSKLTKKARVFKEGSEITNRRIDGNPTQSEKKNKKVPLEGGYSPSMPQGGVMRKINPFKIGGVGKYSAGSDGGVSQSTRNTSMTKSRIKPYFRSSLSPQEPKGNDILCKKKNKQVGAGKASLVPKRTSLLGESSIMRKCLGIKETGPSAQISIGGKGPDLSLNSLVVAHRNEKGGIAKGGDGSDLLLPPRKDTPRGDTQQRNALMHIGESSVSHKSAPDQFFRKGLLCDLNENIAANRMSPLREMQNLGPWVENGSFSRHQHLDFSGTQRTEEVNVQGNDDIPMEIVELLARNQFERYRHETERNFFFSKHTKDKRDTELMGFAQVHGNGMLTSLPEDKCRVTNPVSGMGIVRTSENVGPIKRNPSNFFSETHGNNFNFGQSERNSAFAGCSAFSKYKEKQTGGVQTSDSVRTRNPQNCNWKGSPNESRQGEEEGPNHMAFGFDIPQMHAPQSSSFEFHPQFPKLPLEGKRMIGDHDLNFMKPNANDLEKQKRNSHSESIRRETAEYPFVNKHRGFDLNEKVPGSLDLNSNETIPAMQLLSLMDAGVQSTSAFSLDGSPKFFTKPFFPCPNHPKVLEKPLFAYDHHSNRGPGAYNDIPRNPPSPFYGRNIAEKSCECPPAVPAVAAFVSPLQTEGSFKRGAGFTKSEERGKALMHHRGPKSQKSGSTSGVLRTSCQSNPVQNKQKGIIYPSNTNFMDLEANYMTGTVYPMRGISKEICTLNRNPADFSIPETGNVYMISGKDLKFGKKGYSKGGSGLNTGDGRKRQRVTKLK